MSLSLALRHSFGDIPLEIAFEAPMGVTALFGKSGSGKTSAINAVAGLMRPDWARISFEGRILQDEKTFVPPHQRHMGYVFQDARLFPHLTVAQNLRFGSWFAKDKPKAGEFDRIVQMLDIGALLARRPAKLSGGEKSRVALGRALLSGPQMLLMDEPLAALDEARKGEILPYLERLRDEAGLPILYVSHSMAEVTRLANHLIVLDQGRVVAQGGVAQVLADRQFAGLGQASTLISARYSGCEDGLERYETQAGPVWLALGPEAGRKGTVALRILAQDVMIARNRPEGLSALNILPVQILEVQHTQAEVTLRLSLGESVEVLLAKITQRSFIALNLQLGDRVFAVLKTIAVSANL